MPQLSLCQIVLVLCTVGVVITWVAVDKSVQHYCVEGHSPIGWRWVEGMILPFAPVVERISSCLIGIEVERNLVGVIS